MLHNRVVTLRLNWCQASHRLSLCFCDDDNVHDGDVDDDDEGDNGDNNDDDANLNGVSKVHAEFVQCGTVDAKIEAHTMLKV